ncbi:MAG: S46 family peptidase [Bacteroidales bacterium]|nr:S46 family peptidase [Bacteroidales bacterium]
MKIKSIVLALAMLIVMPGMARADEGMWLLSLLGKNYAEMQKAGFKLTPEDIYSINQSCIKDAIVGLGNDGSPFWHFCTGEIISDQGLISTNHHCGYGKIQEHSTVGHDYLRDGFWAYSKDQELPNPGLTASILVRMEDVTAQVRAALSDDMSESERARAIKEISDKISKKAIEGTPYNATVKSMFNGNQFFLFVHIIYKDVRLVGAPPSSMGKFGGDTDNWSWPRHTCDFSLFRIYTAPDGSPAEYSQSNVPLKPKHHLPVSNRELKEGDFAMVMGFPGTTDRFLTSYGLEETMQISNKLRYEIRTVKINILREEMAASQETRIKYASKYASCSNYWKYSNEQNKALKALNTMAVKKEIERQYLAWAKGKDPKYANALKLIQKGYADRAPYEAATTYIAEGLLTGPELLLEAFRTYNTLNIVFSDSRYEPMREAIMEELIQDGKNFYKDYNMATEKRVMAAMLEYVYKNMDMQYMPDFLVQADKKYKGNFERYVEEMFKKSIFATEESFLKFMQKPNLKVLAKDPIVLAGQSAYEKYVEINSLIPKESRDGLTRGIRDFTDGILQINQNVNFLCPDANSTIRLSYGNVKAYDPRDAVSYSFYTTLRGVMEKEDPNSSEFAVPARLKELFEKKDFGPYANNKGELVTCFVTNNDITGGNSGSPVMDAEGNLIGLAFDGNSEAMSGDIDFEENLQRCICLDTRYMLFVIDKYAGAKNLIDEMTIVTK